MTAKKIWVTALLSVLLFLVVCSAYIQADYPEIRVLDKVYPGRDKMFSGKVVVERGVYLIREGQEVVLFGPWTLVLDQKEK